MRLPDARRLLVLGLLAAVALGFACGWLARVWLSPSQEERARDALGEIRERAHEITH